VGYSQWGVVDDNFYFSRKETPKKCLKKPPKIDVSSLHLNLSTFPTKKKNESFLTIGSSCEHITFKVAGTPSFPPPPT
jgi:hypothetical protein